MHNLETKTSIEKFDDKTQKNLQGKIRQILR